jgi:hypothetical protein
MLTLVWTGNIFETKMDREYLWEEDGQGIPFRRRWIGNTFQKKMDREYL